MTTTANDWDAPLFLGEFGAAAETTNAGDYIAAIYDRMDANLASGAQWCYSPRWNERDKDGWNAEDFSILDSQGEVRPNFRPRPYPRNTAGTPLSFRFQGAQSSGGCPSLEFAWAHRPGAGRHRNLRARLDLPAGRPHRGFRSEHDLRARSSQANPGVPRSQASDSLRSD